MRCRAATFRAGAQANSPSVHLPRERTPTLPIDVTAHENPPRLSYDKAVPGKLGISASKIKPQRPTVAADIRRWKAMCPLIL
jgi:hypothetical protein